ncbi:hypothetical protein QN372_19250 [Undibacterium sp. RTI2.1]|uniref:hypothetical protein n=1 Tax=unclassified Undibacterium TaxID=2630295 RepID=UPI002B22C843|nr:MULTISPECIES: hypothetical protein [unclassified Undibacterium]MEB0032890.1 hypothetical protein [Undibacterium sp. RTI2.1]MEB0118795.1 hypothetical protein [Undibacterium sp. RTI2.2]
MFFKFDEKDELIKQAYFAARSQIVKPLVGDYILFPTGELERFSHEHENSLQTSPSGSFYLGAAGLASFSGGLNPGTPLVAITRTGMKLPGTFWFFHHGESGAHRGVNFELSCRVFITTAPYEGYLGEQFQNKGLQILKDQLKAEMLG